MKILAETETHQFVQYPNDMHAIGLTAVLSGLTNRYGGMTVFNFIEKAAAHVEMKSYGFLQVKGKPDAPVSVPTAFMFWGRLSKPIELIYSQRFRPLQPRELASGQNLWAIDIIAPLGGVRTMLGMWHSLFPTHEAYHMMRPINNGNTFRKHTVKNPSFKKE